MSTSLLDINSLVINGTDAKRTHADIIESLISLGVRETITGASTLEMTLHDPNRALLRSSLFSGGSDAKVGDIAGSTLAGSTGLKGATCVIDGAGFELAAFKKNGSTLSLTWEDMAVAELRRRTGQKVVAAGVMSRAEFCASLIREVSWIRVSYAPGAKSKEQLARGSTTTATVPGGPTGWGGLSTGDGTLPGTLDTQDRQAAARNVVSGATVLDTQDRQARASAAATVSAPALSPSEALAAKIAALNPDAALTTAAQKKQLESTWDACSRIMGAIGWRVFCRRGGIVLAPDAWLMTHAAAAFTVSESSPGVDLIDVSWDVGKPAASATVTVWAGSQDLIPGSAVTLRDMGPGDGTWLVESIDRSVKSRKATCTLIRPYPTLAEPHDASSAGVGAQGEPGFGGAVGTGPSFQRSGSEMGGDSKAAAFVRAALAQTGKPYKWGGAGPGSFDCSHLVAYAARQVGVNLPAPVASQSLAIVNGGGYIPVEQAIRTRGAVLWRGTPGRNGSTDHIVISLGDGTTIEARGRAFPIGSYSATKGRDPWTGGGLIPGIGAA